MQLTVDANDLVDQLPASRLHEVYNPWVLDGILQEATRLEVDMVVVVARHHRTLGDLFHQNQRTLAPAAGHPN